MCRSLEGHGHWVNTMCLNTDYVIRTGAFEPSESFTTAGRSYPGKRGRGGERERMEEGSR